MPKQLESPIELSPIVAGMWRLAEWGFKLNQRVSFIEQCLELGVSSFDHADIYGDYEGENLFGEALAKISGIRDKIQLVSKCGICLVSTKSPETKIKHYDTSYQYIVNSAEKSLRKLGTDYLDCLLIHRPDPLMDAAEVGRAFSDLKKEGKILHAGVSNFLPEQLSLLASCCEFPLAVNQIEVSPMHTCALTNGTLDQCQQLEISPMAWSPLAGGALLTAPCARSQRLKATLEIVASRYTLSGKPVTAQQIGLAWLMRHPAKIKPIIGSGNIERISAATDAVQIQLDRQSWFEILQASTGKDVD